MNNWTNEELQNTFAEVARRAAINPEFRSLALKDSAAAIAKVNPKPLPQGVTFQFVDNSGPHKIVPLPDPVGLPTSARALGGSAGPPGRPARYSRTMPA